MIRNRFIISFKLNILKRSDGNTRKKAPWTGRFESIDCDRIEKHPAPKLR